MSTSTTARPESGLRWRRAFPGEASQLRALRQWIAALLPDCPARDDIACVATELGANAVLWTASGQDGWFAVEIAWHSAALRIAVADSGAPTGPRVINDPAAEHGRGLRLVHGLSMRVGVLGDPQGRLVWADVPWSDEAVAEPDLNGHAHESIRVTSSAPAHLEHVLDLAPAMGLRQCMRTASRQYLPCPAITSAIRYRNPCLITGRRFRASSHPALPSIRRRSRPSLSP